MTNKLILTTLGLALIIQVAPVAGQSPEPAQPLERKAAESSGGPVLGYSPSLDLTSMDQSVDPCVNFYQYACGGWQKKNPIPPDEVIWGVYNKLFHDNLNFLRGVLEEAAAETGQRDAVTQKIGDFYAACMDEATIEKRGLDAIKPDLDTVTQLQSVHDLAPLLARLHLSIPGASILFDAGSSQDPDDAEQQIAEFDQGGLGLPDRDYYIKNDPKSKEIRQRYLQHVQKVFQLLGDKPQAAKKNADAVLRLETALARTSLTRVERRDPYKQKNKMKIEELEKLVPNFDWQSYLRETKMPALDVINVTAPAFFKEVNIRLAHSSLENWKSYLRYHVASGYSAYLSSSFVQERFDFNLRYLRGAQELQPRWKRCVQYTDDQLGEALGQAYVRKVFSPELRNATLDMVHRIETAMDQRINHLDWMSPETKAQALKKLHSIRNKIGYPDRWRDYSAVKITRDDFAGDIARATEFEAARDIGKIGKPVDHAEWHMTPPTVDAYFNGQMNDMNFPAGVLQPPLFDPRMDDAPNYGDTGGTIGHELTHAFDDNGSQYDATGSLKNWWTKEDRQKFEQRTQCIADQYSQYVVVDDVHLNGKLTLGEDVADLGGEILGYLAWKNATHDKNLQPVDGLTPDQRFFIGFAQWDCANERPENLRVNATTNPHSPPQYRINGVVVNMPEFAQAFSCKSGQPMVKPPQSVCKVW
jgi:endothelin-converting enzyme/putative endopeptidase